MRHCCMHEGQTINVDSRTEVFQSTLMKTKTLHDVLTSIGPIFLLCMSRRGAIYFHSAYIYLEKLKKLILKFI